MTSIREPTILSAKNAQKFVWVVRFDVESIYNILGENLSKISPPKSMEKSIFVRLKK